MKAIDTISPLPVTRKECQARGWHELDIILITGDAYVDHPSFGVALIGRLLESKGYRVAILAQPRYNNNSDFKKFGRPRLFFGITGGNLDSIVANYTGNGKVREKDSYSPDGNPWFGKKREKTSRRRPDRASMLYSNLARSAYKDVAIVLGGVEGSLRRFVHYDYKQKNYAAHCSVMQRLISLSTEWESKPLLRLQNDWTRGRISPISQEPASDSVKTFSRNAIARTEKTLFSSHPGRRFNKTRRCFCKLKKRSTHRQEAMPIRG